MKLLTDSLLWIDLHVLSTPVQTRLQKEPCMEERRERGVCLYYQHVPGNRERYIDRVFSSNVVSIFKLISKRNYILFVTVIILWLTTNCELVCNSSFTLAKSNSNIDTVRFAINAVGPRAVMGGLYSRSTVDLDLSMEWEWKSCNNWSLQFLYDLSWSVLEVI